MSWFKKNYPSDAVEKGLKKVRGLYTQMIAELHFGENFSKEFEDRYLENLKSRKLDLPVFLYYEYQTAQALYQQQKQKQEQQREKEARYQAYRDRSLTDKIASQNSHRIEKYDRIEYSDDDELNALLGAIRSFYLVHWQEIDSIISPFYRTSADNPIALLYQDLLDFISKREEELPTVLLPYQRACKINKEEKAIEAEKNIILKKAGLMLNKLKKQLLFTLQNQLFSSQDKENRLSLIMEELSQILSDFRLSHFSG